MPSIVVQGLVRTTGFRLFSCVLQVSSNLSCQVPLGGAPICPYHAAAIDIDSAPGMFTSLTRTRRYRAGLVVALAYLLCILGPSLAYAIGGNQIAAPCFGNDHVVPAMHMHHDGHQHASHQNEANDTSNNQSHAHDPGGKPSSGPCCAMLCISGLPASAIKDLTPFRPVSICPPEAFQAVSGQGPVRRYRPPIG